MKLFPKNCNDFYTDILKDVLLAIHNNDFQDNYVEDDRPEVRGAFLVDKRIRHFLWFHQNLENILCPSIIR